MTSDMVTIMRKDIGRYSRGMRGQTERPVILDPGMKNSSGGFRFKNIEGAKGRCYPAGFCYWSDVISPANFRTESGRLVITWAEFGRRFCHWRDTSWKLASNSVLDGSEGFQMSLHSRRHSRDENSWCNMWRNIFGWDADFCGRALDLASIRWDKIADRHCTVG